MSEGFEGKAVTRCGPCEQVWRPTFALVNSQTEELMLLVDANRTMVQVGSDGEVTYVISRRLVAGCKQNVRPVQSYHLPTTHKNRLPTSIIERV